MIEPHLSLTGYLLYCVLGVNLWQIQPDSVPPQVSIPDSLEYILSQAETDSARAYIYSRQTWKVRLSYPKLAVIYSLKAIEIAKKANLPIMQVDALTDLGYTYEVMGDGKNALKYYYAGYELANEISYVWGAIDGVTGSGSAYRILSDFDKAIEMYSKAVYLASEDKRPLLPNDTDRRMTNHYKPLLLGDAYNNIGTVYNDQSKFELALEYHQKSLELYPDGNKTKVLALVNIGQIHLDLQNLDKAIQYSEQAKRQAIQMEDNVIEALASKLIGKINRQLGNYQEALLAYLSALKKFQDLDNSIEIAKVYHEIGSVYFDQEQYQNSIQYNELGLNHAREAEDKVGQCFALLALGKSYMLLDDYAEAEEALQAFMSLSPEIEDQVLIRDGFRALGILYERTHRYQEAYESQMNYIAVNDSIFSAEKSRQIAEMEARYETAQKEKEIELLNAENQIKVLQLNKQESQRVLLIVAILVSIGIAIILYSRYVVKTQANKKLQELDKLKTRFFTNISHEFRTPLTMIIGPVRTKLAEGESSDASFLRMISQNAERLLQLVNQLLDLAKLDASHMKLQLREGDINQFLITLIDPFDAMALEKKINFEKKLSEQSIVIPFDPDKVQKVFTNLLINAFKFTSAGGNVIIESAFDTGQYSIAVTDTGKGISADHLPTLFNRFNQLDESSGEGTGIGLALAKELIELHHGRITVESQVGIGTTFRVFLPTDRNSYVESDFVTAHLVSDDTPVNFDNVKDKPEPFKGQDAKDLPTVLVVEDNDDVRTYIGSILQVQYHVQVARNGSEGLEKALKTIPDLVVSDLMMPEMDGLEFCKQLKMNELTSHIPIVLLTAKATVESKIEGLHTGADDYLTKPFDHQELMVRVNNLITERRKLRKLFGTTISLEPAMISITPPDEVFLTKARDIVEENIGNIEFTVEDFQRSLGVSRMHLHRKLKALTNSSASEFIRTIRLQRAAQILKTKGVNVSEAAYDTGFNNLSYFAKCFKEQFGMSPSAFQDQTIPSDS
ncbi:MAG: tetratricopeptide repeat protein [Cyclobacteriaceae bacterium]|nr:tetratricopeptide repeat protein [Cyclobacteriaceae bacterium HetDA_MAG_MS6]